MTKRHYSRELLKDVQLGHAIVTAVSPYAGTPVDYRPRNHRDPFPWVFAGADRVETRYSGRECMAVDGCKRSFVSGRKCRLPRDHDKACQSYS